MNESERDLELLSYIMESIGWIEQYCRGGREAFLQQQLVQDAVLHRLETLAEATNRPSPALKQRHDSIPWRDIYGFRNVLAHGYLVLNLDLVWQTIEIHLPVLRAVVDEELRHRDS